MLKPALLERVFVFMCGPDLSIIIADNLVEIPVADDDRVFNKLIIAGVKAENRLKR